MGILTTAFKAVGSLVGWHPAEDLESSDFFTAITNFFRSTSKQGKLTLEYKNLVYSCVSINAQTTAKYEFMITNRNTGITLKKHPLYDLIRHPNTTMSEYELWEATQTFLDLTGEAFWYVVIGQATERPKYIAALLKPNKMKMLYDKASGELVGYEFDAGNGRKIPLDIKEVVPFKRFDPNNQQRGVGPTEAGKLYIDIENETSLFQWGVLKNQASPAGVLSFKGNITRNVFNKIKRQWNEQYAGTNNAGKTLFIRESESAFTKVGLSLTDLQIGDLSQVNDRKIRKLFGVPRELLGDNENSGLGRANIEAIEYIYAKYRIDPNMIRFDDTLTLLLTRYWDDTDFAVSHVSPIPQDKVAELAENTAAVDKWLTRNEIRAQKGLDPVPGGDVLYTSFSNIPVESQQDATTPQVAVAASYPHIHKHSKKKLKITKGRRQFYSLLDQIELRSGKQYSTALTAELEKQQTKVIAEMNKRDIGKDVNANDLKNIKGVIDIVFHWDTETVSHNLLAHLINAFLRSGEATLDSIGKPDESFIIGQAQRDAIFESTDRLMKSFNEETALKMQQQLAQGLAAGESKEQVQARIESIFADSKGYRAARIADTEMHKAVNSASAQAYKDQGYTKLRWEANPDACEFCKALHGTETPIDEPFVKEGSSVTGLDGGEYQNNYVDVQFADLHPNCRCRLVPVK